MCGSKLPHRNAAGRTRISYWQRAQAKANTGDVCRRQSGWFILGTPATRSAEANLDADGRTQWPATEWCYAMWMLLVAQGASVGVSLVGRLAPESIDNMSTMPKNAAGGGAGLAVDGEACHLAGQKAYCLHLLASRLPRASQRRPRCLDTVGDGCRRCLHGGTDTRRHRAAAILEPMHSGVVVRVGHVGRLIKHAVGLLAEGCGRHSRCEWRLRSGLQAHTHSAPQTERIVEVLLWLVMVGAAAEKCTAGEVGAVAATCRGGPGMLLAVYGRADGRCGRGLLGRAHAEEAKAGKRRVQRGRGVGVGRMACKRVLLTPRLLLLLLIPLRVCIRRPGASSAKQASAKYFPAYRTIARGRSERYCQIKNSGQHGKR